MNCDILVIGGGPAGIMAAGKAALEGARVILVEKEKEIGFTLVSSVDEDALLTNLSQRIQFQHNIHSGADFVEMAIKLFSPRKFLLFLEGLGIPVTTQKELLIAAKESPETILAKVKSWLQNCGVKILTNTTVTALAHADGQIKEAQATSEERELCITTSNIIVATGGKTGQSSGEHIEGYHFANLIGHTITPIFPSLVPLKLGERSTYKQLQGLSLPDSRLYLWGDNRKIADKQGEVIFNYSGIEGDATINISRYVAEAIDNDKGITLTLDTIPHIDEGDLEKEFTELFAQNPKEKIISLLTQYIPHRLSEFLITHVCKLDTNTTGAQVSGQIRKQVRGALKRWELPLLSTESIEKAHMTAGGVCLDELNKETMESYICAGLYFAGEILDIDANRAGFNMHLAFATGRLAGESAAKNI